MGVFDTESHEEAQMWKEILFQDEEKVFWVDAQRPDGSEECKLAALQQLSQDIIDFANGLLEVLDQENDVGFTHYWNAMLSCYTGSRSYSFHVDNPHDGD